MVNDNFSEREINYFYEVAVGNKANNRYRFTRWNKDILYRLVGDTTNEGQEALRQMIKEVKAHGFPFDISEAGENEPNLIVEFGPQAKVRLGDHAAGDATNQHAFNQINGSRIRISTEFNETQYLTLWHELMHALGLPSHTLTDTRDALFPNSNSNATNENFDKTQSYSALEILYHEKFPRFYVLQDFELDFGKSLYHLNGRNILSKFCQTNEIGVEHLSDILEYGFAPLDTVGKWWGIQFKDTSIAKNILRYPRNIGVICSGQLPTQIEGGVKTLVREICATIDDASDNFRIKFFEHRPARFIGIDLHFAHNNKFDHAFTTTTTYVTSESDSLHKDVSGQVIVKSKLGISYGDHLPNHYREMLASIIYQNLIFKYNRELVRSFKKGSERLTIENKYIKLLDLYYANELPRNFHKDSLRALLGEIQIDSSKVL